MHKKSRLGCLVCKRRHTKCDETRPACTNCTSTGRECRYAPERTPPRDGTGSRSPLFSHPPIYDTGAAAATSDWIQHLVPDLVADLRPDHSYDLQHMRLWHHIAADMDNWLEVTEAMRPIARIYIDTALSSRYCMDQLLALAALHLSTVSHENSQRYRDHAAQLQTRALAGFQRAIEGDASRVDATAVFAFSSIIGVQVLAEKLSQSRDDDFGAFLDGIVDYLRHHRGARILGHRFWNNLRSSELIATLAAGGVQNLTSAEHADGNDDSVEGSSPGAAAGDCPRLVAMVEASTLNNTSSQVCLDAIRSLGTVRARLEGPGSWGVHVLLGWPNMLDVEFVELLERRVPEALVVLAHFSGYLHRRRDFWVFGNAGERLIRGIADHLGRHWMKWMEEPLAMVKSLSVASH